MSQVPFQPLQIEQWQLMPRRTRAQMYSSLSIWHMRSDSLCEQSVDAIDGTGHYSIHSGFYCPTAIPTR
ncbi:hypothetical protein IEO21_03492 [Rhodonia placenta]|uniref:Uncharacterized protein n=1 Tax=Rhodonia placenta TaxID=104341 RepID=A0A8H7P5I3_9APHY|nr:hypothetical protein IEO21_03492 [Postia placenta]